MSKIAHVITPESGDSYTLTNGVQLELRVWPAEVRNMRGRVTGHNWGSMCAGVYLAGTRIRFVKFVDTGDLFYEGELEHLREELMPVLSGLGISDFNNRFSVSSAIIDKLVDLAGVLFKLYGKNGG